MKRLTAIIAILLLVGSMFLGRDTEAVCRLSADESLTVAEMFFSDGAARQTLVSQMPTSAATAPQASSIIIRSNFLFHRTVAEAVCRNSMQIMQRAQRAVRHSVQIPLTESSAVDFYIITLRRIII